MPAHIELTVANKRAVDHVMLVTAWVAGVRRQRTRWDGRACEFRGASLRGTTATKG